MITPQHRQESLARAYFLAIAGHVGLSHSVPYPDLGIDFTLHGDTTTRERKQVMCGVSLDIQLKSTMNAIVCDEEVKYDLKVRAYNVLRCPRVVSPRILVLHVQPKEEHERLKLTQEGLTLRGRCYWVSLRGCQEVPNESAVRIAIPRSNVFSADSLGRIMERVRVGGLP